MNLDKQIQWFSHHLPVLYIGGVILFIITCVIIFFSNQAFVYIEVDKSVDTSTLKTYASSDSGSEQTASPTGLQLVSRKTKSIIVTKSDYIKTQIDVSFPWYGYVSKKVTFKEDFNAEKVAYYSTTGAECMTYNRASDSLLYYNCRNPKVLLKYNTPKNASWGVSAAAAIYYANRSVTPYMGGVIGIADNSEDTTTDARYRVIYAKPDGSIVTYNAPDSLVTLSAVQGAVLYTDTTNTENSRFIIVDGNGSVYLGTPQGNTVSYATIEKPSNYTSNNNTLCSMSGETATCYRGQSPVGDIDSSQRRSLAGTSITTVNFNGSGAQTTEIRDFKESVDTIVEVNGVVYLKSYKQLSMLEKKDTSFTAKELAQNVDSIAATDTLYYIQNNGVFSYSPTNKSAKQVFYSPNVLPKKLYGADGILFFAGRVPSNSAVTYAYKLTSLNNTTRRLIDTFPQKYDMVYSVDLVGNRLSVVLTNVTNLSDTRQVLDQNKFSAAKNEFFSKLREDGININDIEIEFLY